MFQVLWRKLANLILDFVNKRVCPLLDSRASVCAGILYRRNRGTDADTTGPEAGLQKGRRSV